MESRLSSLKKLGAKLDIRGISVQQLFSEPDILLEIGINFPVGLRKKLGSYFDSEKRAIRECTNILTKLNTLDNQEKLALFYSRVFSLKYIPIDHYRRTRTYWGRSEHRYRTTHDAWKYVDLTVKEYYKAISVTSENIWKIRDKYIELGLDPYKIPRFASDAKRILLSDPWKILSGDIDLEMIKILKISPWTIVTDTSKSGLVSLALRMVDENVRVSEDVILWASGTYMKHKIKKGSTTMRGQKNVEALKKINELADLLESL